MILIFNIIVYSQPIPLSKERNQFLYHEDIMLLTDMTIPQYLRILIPIKCKLCNMLLEINENQICFVDTIIQDLYKK